jgi:phosphohistidine phosphatase
MPSEIELVLVRHAKAGDRDPVKYPDDSERKLTDIGRKQMHQVAKGLSRILSEVDVILTSPYTRAAETAEILAPIFSPKRAVETYKELSPGGSVKALLAHLQKMPNRCLVMLVGHEPDLSGLVAEFIGADETDGLILKKGGCCRIVFEDELEMGAGKLLWLLTPSILRELA